jgi:tetratricopeptide (TPR) repeat protein
MGQVLLFILRPLNFTGFTSRMRPRLCAGLARPRWLAALLFMLLGMCAQASQDNAQHELAHLLTQEQTRSSNLGYNYRVAELSLSLGRLDTALTALERIVVQVPNDLGARLDFALVCYRLGHIRCARQQLEALQLLSERTPVPPAARRAMFWLSDQLEHTTKGSQAQAAIAPTGVWFLEAGYDTNANLGADSRDIRLNLWGELPITLQLADGSMRQPDTYLEAGTLMLLPINRILPAASDALALSGSHWLLGFNHRDYRTLEGYEQSSLYTGLQGYSAAHKRRASILLSQQWLGLEPYRLRLIVDVEQRWPDAEQWYVSGRYEWINEQSIRLPDSYRLVLGAGHRTHSTELQADASFHRRPGRIAGDTLELGLGARWASNIAPDVIMNLFGSVRYLSDTDPYSPQFFGDTQRQDVTWAAGVELTRRWALGRVSWETRYDSTHSTITLHNRDRLLTRLQYRVNW